MKLESYRSPSGERRRPHRPPLIGGKAEIEAIVKGVAAGKCCRFIGPRYHHKSQIMRTACMHVQQALNYAALYVSLRDARSSSEKAFYASLRDLVAEKVERYYDHPLDRTACRSSTDFRLFLAALPGILGTNVVLFVDDLELDVVPPDYIQELLLILRSAYQMTVTRLALMSVVSASNSLARTALGSTSPFENISILINARDLTPVDSAALARQTLAGHKAQATPDALRLIFEETAGDRFLISQVCDECCNILPRSRVRRVTRPLVRTAITNLVQSGGRAALAEGLRQIESDPDLLRAVVLLMENDRVPTVDLPFDPKQVPDPLTTSGFGMRVDHAFTLKSRLHRRILDRAFAPDRVGRLFLAAGDWEHALLYLKKSIRRADEPNEERHRIMAGAVSAMYSGRDPLEAYGYLAQGLDAAYPDVAFQIYKLDERRRCLVLVYPAPGEGAKRPRPISLESLHRPEVQAMGPHEYWWHGSEDRRLTLMIPLRIGRARNVGLVVFEKFVTQLGLRRHHDEVLELVGYLNNAARALQNRMDHAGLLESAKQRARDLQDLVTLTRRLMGSQREYVLVLELVLKGALLALGRRAQMGSIFLYDRRTGLLTMSADTGYPPELRAAARLTPGEGLAGYVYATGRSWVVDDTASNSHYATLPGIGPKVYSSVGVPLMGRHGPIGVLCLDNTQRPRAFSPENERWLKLLAGQVALWLENLRLMEILSDLNSSIIALRELSSSDPRQLLERLAAQLLKNWNLNGCLIGIREPSDQIRFIVREGFPRVPDTRAVAELPRRLVQDVLERGATLARPDLRRTRGEWMRLLDDPTLTSLIALPLTGEQGQHGFVLLACAGRFSPSAEEVALLRSFANQATIALENARLYRRVNGELDQRILELQKANAELEIQRGREAHYRSARLATGLLHEIKNAIANVPELADELEQNVQSPEKLAKLLQELRFNAAALTEVNQKLQRFVNIGEPTMHYIDLVAVVEQVLNGLAVHCPKHVHLQPVRVCGPVPPIRAARELIEMVLKNLVQNAWESIPTSRSGQVSVELTPDHEGCAIRVRDTGTGIPADNLDKIWEWGWSTKTHIARAHDLGLGLFLCRDIVEVHQGTIRVESTSPEQGTTILVWLPALSSHTE